MTSRELIRWSSLHERRARTGGVLTSSIAFALLGGAALAAWVYWRASVSDLAGSHAWRAATAAVFALGFMRVPFHVYWRGDGSLLATLPVSNVALFDAALWRCVRAAATTTLAVSIAALPLGTFGAELLVRHIVLGIVMGFTAATLMPAVVVWTASLVALDDGQAAASAIRTATTVVAGARVGGPQMAAAAQRGSSSALLGAVPGAVSAIVLFVFLVTTPWVYAASVAPAPLWIAVVVALGALALVGARARGSRAMGAILRDVSSLDRQRLATLEIHPPTALERGIAKLTGEASLAYGKDARLMRRRYPMAYALGAVIFVTLVGMSFRELADPAPWMGAIIGGAALYGIVLGRRLHRAPIELPRLTMTLPIAASAYHRAKVAWVLGWWIVFVAIPGIAAVITQLGVRDGLLLLGGATLAVIVAALLGRDVARRPSGRGEDV